MVADIRLSSSSALRVDPPAFTGESATVVKDQATLLPGRTPPGPRTTMVLPGTMIEQERDIGGVVGTGADTALGTIGTSLRIAKATPPSFVVRLDRLAQQMSVATIAPIIPFALVLLMYG